MTRMGIPNRTTTTPGSAKRPWSVGAVANMETKAGSAITATTRLQTTLTPTAMRNYSPGAKHVVINSRITSSANHSKTLRNDLLMKQPRVFERLLTGDATPSPLLRGRGQASLLLLVQVPP